MTAKTNGGPNSGAAWSDDPVGYLIGPNDPAEFFSAYYERQPLIVARDDRDRYAPLLSIAAIDELIASVDLNDGALELTQAEPRIHKSEYVFDNGIVDRGAVTRRYQMGATIILPQLHQSEAPLGDFCRALESVMSAHVQTNIYLTPPNAQGFRTHYDNHDVFVVQVSGEKDWRLYQTPVDTPYRGEGFQPGRHDVGEAEQEFTLKAGDCAYVPRGLMHDASTAGDEPSLHITVGIIVRTWADLMLEAVSEVALRDVNFRRSLPIGYARSDFDRSQAKAHFDALIKSIGENASIDNAFDLFVDNFIRSRSPNTRGAVLDGTRPVTNGERYAARRNTPWRIAEEGERLIVMAPGGEVNFTLNENAAVERALSGDAFSIADLPGLEDAAALVVLRKLTAFGLVTRI